MEDIYDEYSDMHELEDYDEMMDPPLAEPIPAKMMDPPLAMSIPAEMDPTLAGYLDEYERMRDILDNSPDPEDRRWAKVHCEWLSAQINELTQPETDPFGSPRGEI